MTTMARSVALPSVPLVGRDTSAAALVEWIQASGAMRIASHKS
jgi:hypothetical protein